MKINAEWTLYCIPQLQLYLKYHTFNIFQANFIADFAIFYRFARKFFILAIFRSATRRPAS